MNEREKLTLSVSELNEYLRMQMEGDRVLCDLWVRGEISNFVNHRSGHWYFTLKDPEAQVKAVMFKFNAMRARFLPKDGMKVLLHGRVSVYTQAGQYQIYAEEIQPDGVGSLALQFEQLRRKLETEGLFDPRRKKPIPKYPARIGVITSPTGAAIQDIKNILGRRFPCAEVFLFPSLVQGDGAAEQLIGGLLFFEQVYPVDVIILGRGGGSMEDLWAFNDEMLARTVADCRIPVISAVGHESDFTICDFVADLRAPTPSAAAELAVPDRRELSGMLSGMREQMAYAVSQKISMEKKTVAKLSSARVFAKPDGLLDPIRMRVADLTRRTDAAVDRAVERKKSELGKLCAKLEALNPMGVLSRGYAAVSRGEDLILRAGSVRAGDELKIRFADGVVCATAKETGDKNGKENNDL